MRSFKFALIVAAVVGSSAGLAHAQLQMAQKGMFTAEDAYSQMGGLSFELASLNDDASGKLAQLVKAN